MTPAEFMAMRGWKCAPRSPRNQPADSPIGRRRGGCQVSEQAAALAGLAPIAHDSGAMRGKRAIGGGRRLLRHVMFQAALVASHHNPLLKIFADRLRAAGKPHKVVITAVARKLVTIANAIGKSRLKWSHQAA
ncbi:transposase [Sagittula stellata]